MMTDEELDMWATYGESVRGDTVPLGVFGPAGDIAQLWRITSELTRRVLNDQPGTPEGA